YSMPWRMNVGHFPNEVTDHLGQKFSYFVVMPFVTKWEEQYQIDPGAMIDYVIANYPNRIDLNRIYLTAMSRGTDNILGYATASSTNASRLAAIAPVANCFPANVGTPGYAQQVSNLATGNVRMWGISCANDRVCTEQYMINWVKSLDSLKPGYSRFTYPVIGCNGADSSFHYAWNDAYNPDYRPAPNNKNLYEWLIQYARNAAPPPPPPPPPGPVNCSTIVVTGDVSSIKFKGLLAPVVTVQVFNSSWATVFNQTLTNYPDSLVVPNLATGTYFTRVTFYSSSWVSICEKSQNITVGTTAPPPPPPPPPPTGTPDCSKVSVVTGSNSLKVKGLIAPVAAVQVFNNSWVTVFNQTYTNSPDSITISSLPAGAYHVKVAFYTSSWSFVCERFIDATVGAGNTAAEGRIETIAVTEGGTERIIEVTARSMTVAPNPFSNTIWVTIGSNRNENATIVLMDVAGREVMRKAITLQKGINKVTFDGMNRYRPGGYILRLVRQEGVENLRMLRQ
ncbi:MAG TPA: T9SS type A sorting domain-containing protein, partial [Chitinophagaceae bacterium]